MLCSCPDMSHCDHRLLVELNGLKLHVYNRSQVYSQLETFFGLESLLIPDSNKENKKENERDSHDMSFWTSWRDLVPVIKFDLSMVGGDGSACSDYYIYITTLISS